jgi:hypothetical protein
MLDGGSHRRQLTALHLPCAVQTPQGVAPNVALRFDYSQTGAGLTPFVSVLYTDFVGAIPIGLPAKAASAGAPAINIAQSFGLFISQNGTLYPGQG